MKFEIEIERNNVTPAQFLAYCRHRVDKKSGCRSDLDLDYFKRGDDLNFDINHKKMNDGIYTKTGCEYEKSVSEPYKMQTYVRHENGAVYNEICEFDFDNEKTGHGYYYLISVDPETESEEKTEETETMTTEKNDPIYIDERWPESNEHDGVYYIIAYTTADGCRHDRTKTTADDLRTIIDGCRRNGYQIITCKRIENGAARDVIPETRQEKTDRKNREHCKRIAEELEEYAEGLVYTCPECGSICTIEEDENDDGETIHKTSCGCCLEDEPDEQLSVLDFIQDAYDIEYRVGSDREYRSVKIMVACGGPNIYIDTARRLVTLHWWCDYAEYPISSTACDALDEYMEEYWGCM